MKIQYALIIMILLTLIVVLSGCINTSTQTQNATSAPSAIPAASKYPINVTDSFGKTTTITRMPERIVSLSPANTEILFDLGLGSKIVGNTDYDDYPAEAKNITHVSGYSTVSYEKIIAVNPDVIFAEDITGEEASNNLRDKGYNVVELKNSNMSMIIKNIGLVGNVTSTESNATALISDINGRLDSIGKKTAGLNASQKPTVLMFAGYVKDSDIYVYGNNTYGNDMIILDGGVNAAGNISEYKVMSKEAIIQADPDYIIVPVDGTMTTQADFDGLKNGSVSWMKDLKAIKNGHVVMVDGNLMMHPGPRMPDAALAMAKAIHPELFA
ncbi:MAG TPA: ABC transporter substrate-binding protein [Methanocella sp.]|nr:ABC transporter substrate-binding protein [Methanocella sp.]